MSNGGVVFPNQIFLRGGMLLVKMNQQPKKNLVVKPNFTQILQNFEKAISKTHTHPSTHSMVVATIA
jgi:hypothetical protein